LKRKLFPVQDVIENTKPSIIIHAAAERAPDVVEKDFETAVKLNVTATKVLAKIAAKKNIPIIYISTDYVFDGTNPPYKESDQPGPTNKYGITKLEGEKVTLVASNDHIVLRIPVLYGEVEHPAESAVTCLLDSLLNGKAQKVSDYEIRWPAHTKDIAAICYHLADKKIEDPNIKGIFQWSGKEGLTKYAMIQIISEEFSLPHDHIVPDANPNLSVPRPYNCQLGTCKLEELGIGQHTSFREGIKECLKNFIKY